MKQISFASWALVIGLALCGCKKASDTSSASSASLQPSLTPSKTPSLAPVEDPNVTEFKMGMKRYIEEALSFARGMDVIIERPAYKKRVAMVTEMYSRIPEPPAGNKAYDTCYKAARQIAVNFEAGDMYLQLVNDFERLHSKSDADKTFAVYKDLAAKQKKDINELASALNEAREPNIELSDVIKGKK